MTYRFFKMAAGSHDGFGSANGRPPTSRAVVGVSVFLKFQLDRTYSSADIAIFNFSAFYLEIVSPCPLLGGF